jgi:uncharacterized protein
MNSPKPRCSNRFKKGVLVVAGTFCLAIGAVGIFVPILPTTPFLLLAAACYAQGSQRMHHWLLNNKWFGNYIRNYREGKGISARGKIFTLSLLWITIGCSALFLIDIDIVQVILLLVAVAVSIHLVTIPTFRKPQIYQ